MCTMYQILTYVWKHSHLLDEKSSVSFGRWCSGKKIDFLNVIPKQRKADDGQTPFVRPLYVLKERYFCTYSRLLSLFNYFHILIRCEIEGLTVVGYARKSRTDKSEDTRTRLMNTMCENSKTRSMVDKIFVSCKSDANEPIASRDIDDKDYQSSEIADGNTQVLDILVCVSTKNTCLVVLTFAGLTTIL
ncbi:unnamed protein product [Mucor hiemalis]